MKTVIRMKDKEVKAVNYFAKIAILNNLIQCSKVLKTICKLKDKFKNNLPKTIKIH